MKMKTNIPKCTECGKVSAWREIYSCKCLYLRKGKNLNKLNFFLKKMEKEGKLKTKKKAEGRKQ